MDSFFTLLSNPFIQMALMTSALISIACGVIGSYVVIKRMSFISGSIAHSILGGIGLCLYLQYHYPSIPISPMTGSILAAIASALLIAYIHLNFKQRQDAVIASIWSIGMSLGLIFMSLIPSYSMDLESFLVGNILWVSFPEQMVLLGLDLLIIFIVSFLYKQLLLLCFDEQEALLQGLNVQALYYLLLTLIALSIVLLIHTIGMLLLISLLTLPASMANIWTQKLLPMMLLASGFSFLFSCLGIIISYYLNLPAGASICLISASSYLLHLLFAKNER